MTIIDVDTDGFADAARIMGKANTLLAEHARSALAKLSGVGSMAGSDAHGSAWASSYDSTAAAIFRGCSAATSALFELEGGLQATGQNHAHAEALSTGQAGAPEACIPPGSEVCSFGLPSSAAGGCVPQPEGWDLVASIVGHAWPDGDPDKLRLAGSAWGNLAEGLESIHSSQISKATTPLASFQSPEIPLIDTKVSEVSTSLQSLATSARQMEDYSLKMADLINGLQIAIIGMLVLLAAQLVVVTEAGGVLAIPSGGIAAGIAAAADGAMILQTGTAILALVSAWIIALKLQQDGIDSIQELVEVAVERLSQVKTGGRGPRDGEENRPFNFPAPIIPTGGTAPLVQTQPDKDDNTLVIYLKDDWTAAQKAEAMKKVMELDALAKLKALKNIQQARGNHVRDRFRRDFPEKEIDNPYKDVDHIHELQLNGTDDTRNMDPLDPSVNRSIGAQIHNQIYDDVPGQVYDRVVLAIPEPGQYVDPGIKDGYE